MSDFTLSVQEQKLKAKQPKLWGWRWLFMALVQIQHNQKDTNKLLVRQNDLLSKQINLLRSLQPHRITDEDVAFIKEMQAVGEGSDNAE